MNRWVKMLVLSLAVVIAIMYGCSAGTSRVLAKDTSVENWLEKDKPAKEEKSDQKQSPDKANESSGTMSDTSLIFNMVKVIIVLGLILFLIYYVIKFLNKRNKMLQKVKAMENLGGISVGTNKSVQIIRIGQQFYMLGVGDNVEMLNEITNPDTIKSLVQQQEADEAKSSKPGLSSVLPMMKNKSVQQTEQGSDFKKQLMQELSRMKTTRQQIVKQQKEDSHE